STPFPSAKIVRTTKFSKSGKSAPKFALAPRMVTLRQRECLFVRRGLSQRASVGNAALGQVIRRERHGDRITRQDTDEMLADFPRDMSDDLMPIFQFHPELRIRQGLRDFALYLDRFFFSHDASFSNSRRSTAIAGADRIAAGLPTSPQAVGCPSH